MSHRPALPSFWPSFCNPTATRELGRLQHSSSSAPLQLPEHPPQRLGSNLCCSVKRGFQDSPAVGLFRSLGQNKCGYEWFISSLKSHKIPWNPMTSHEKIHILLPFLILDSCQVLWNSHWWLAQPLLMHYILCISIYIYIFIYLFVYLFIIYLYSSKEV